MQEQKGGAYINLSLKMKTDEGLKMKSEDVGRAWRWETMMAEEGRGGREDGLKVRRSQAVEAVEAVVAEEWRWETMRKRRRKNTKVLTD